MCADDDSIQLDFAEGLKQFFTKGSMVTSVRLTKRAKEIILLLIEEDEENTSCTFDVDDNEPGGAYDIFMRTMLWIRIKITRRTDIKIEFDGAIADELHQWTLSKKYHPLSGEKDFSIAMRWCVNQWSRKYAQGALMVAREEACKRYKNKEYF